MTAMPSREAPPRRGGRALRPSPVDKVEARRRELAGAALRTLAERGYANTSLREIAQNSEFTHGVLHYYFADKTELIISCVRVYKERCVRHYDDVDRLSSSTEDLVERFQAALARSLRDDCYEQRLWYDLRAQSLFEPSFREPVAAIDTVLRTMVWRILTRYAQLCGGQLNVDPETAYALFDGVFSHAVQKQLADCPDVQTWLADRVGLLMPRLVTQDTP